MSPEFQRKFIEQGVEIERLRFALHGCMAGARVGEQYPMYAVGMLKHIEKTAHDALYGNGEEALSIGEESNAL